MSTEHQEAEVARELVHRIGEGDRSAEEELVRRYSRGLTFHLRRTTRDPTLADDLHQETFRIVLERLRERGIDDPERLGGFILRTGRNLFIGQWRKANRRGETVDPGEVELADPTPDQLDETVREEEARGVVRLLGELQTERDRQILFRFYVAEEEKESICEELDLSETHFNRVLFRARQRFRGILEGAGWQPGIESWKKIDERVGGSGGS